MQVRDSGDGRRPDSIVDQRDLAEMAARPESGDLGAALRHDGLAIGDDEEADPLAGAFADDVRAGTERPLVEVLRQLLEMLPVETREHRNPRQRVDHVRCHAPMVTDRNALSMARSESRQPADADSLATTACVRPHARDGSRGRRIRTWFEANVT